MQIPTFDSIVKFFVPGNEFRERQQFKVQNMLFYNMGSSYTQAALIHFSNDIEKEKDGQGQIEHKRIHVY